MLSETVNRERNLTETQEVTRDAGRLMSKKIWLPKALYIVLPYFYFVAGIGAFLTTLYISHWSWILPHYLLFAAACVHLGLLVYRKRQRR